MSAQCWCYDCAGRIVDRRTFIRHGRHAVPAPPVVHPEQRLESMVLIEDDSSEDAEGSTDDDEEMPWEEDASNTEMWSSLLGADVNTEPPAFGRGAVTGGQVDYMCTFMYTDYELCLHCMYTPWFYVYISSTL